MTEGPPSKIPPPPPSAGFSLSPPRASAIPPAFQGRKFYAFVVAVLAVTVVGFLTGIAQEERAAKQARPTTAQEAPAPGYRDLRSMRRGANAGMYVGAIDAFEKKLPGPLDVVPVQGAEQRARVLADRKERRAYDGAPPVIPHAVRADGAFECLGCHENGAQIGGKTARAMSHERHDNCTQCHAPPSGLRAPPAPPLTENTFAGLAPAASGARAWPGAPPVIPHPTAMRTECGSCHGVAGALGMRSSHPWRQSCPQCHAPQADLDQRGTRTGTP